MLILIRLMYTEYRYLYLVDKITNYVAVKLLPFLHFCLIYYYSLVISTDIKVDGLYKLPSLDEINHRYRVIMHLQKTLFVVVES